MSRFNHIRTERGKDSLAAYRDHGINGLAPLPGYLSREPHQPPSSLPRLQSPEAGAPRAGAGRGGDSGLGAQRMAPGKKNAWRLKASLVFIDESGLLMAPLVRRTWAPVGSSLKTNPLIK